MNAKPGNSDSPKPNADTESPAARYRVRLPGFLVEEEVGLGNVIKKATASAGITPCGPCQKRAAALNRWMSFR